MFFSLHTERRKQPTPAIFLDRDGTINVEKNYLHRIEDWEWITGSQTSIADFISAGFLVVVISNQAGIARGMFSKDDVEKLHQFVLQDLEHVGTKIDAFFYCPHHPLFTNEIECNCRKPKPTMLLNAAEMLNIDLKNSWMIGDKVIDLQAGLNAGTNVMHVLTGYGTEELREHNIPSNILSVVNLEEAKTKILGMIQ